MTAFNIDMNTELSEIIGFEINQRFDIVIERTESGLSLRVYPRTNGELWDFPFTTFEVDESEIVALEQEMEEES
jgi:hypothetical protein